MNFCLEFESIFDEKFIPIHYHEARILYYGTYDLLFCYKSNIISCNNTGAIYCPVGLNYEEAKMINNLLTKEFKDNFNLYFIFNYKNEILNEINRLETTTKLFVDEIFLSKNINSNNVVENVKLLLAKQLSQIENFRLKTSSDDSKMDYDCNIYLLLCDYYYNFTRLTANSFLKNLFNNKKTEDYYALKKRFYGFMLKNFRNTPSREFLDQIPEIDHFKNLIKTNVKRFANSDIQKFDYFQMIMTILYPDKTEKAKKEDFVFNPWHHIYLKLNLFLARRIFNGNYNQSNIINN
ncbi:hypothetical protein A0H76_913 [Hepatospora eriocheir]|uniref:Uncharacterized protein n=1 Tax=Hepatospora eriocheir TaxID=1081669 RepID=A0A1X0QI46_9MICR|nr:hypothetical protein A0H76_913 [Hepatospora eriocheir]